MADYTVSVAQKGQYNRLTDSYRDSILLVNNQESVTYQIVKADRYNVHGQCKEAIAMLEDYTNKHKMEVHDEAILYYTLSNSDNNIGISSAIETIAKKSRNNEIKNFFILDTITIS
jgi:predicted Zn-dependent protease